MLVPPKLEEFVCIGKSVPPLGIVEKVTGTSAYTHDLNLPRMLHGKVKRSPYPHAKVIDVDIMKAESLPGVRAVVTARNSATHLYGHILADTPVLAEKVVRYVGEPVAAVAAETPEIAEEAVELISVRYEEMPALLDPGEALRTDPPVILHPNLISYETGPVFAPRFDPERPNVCNHIKIRKGDLERGFREADVIVDNRFKTPAAHTAHLEPCVSVAAYDAQQNLTVWTSTQAAYRIKYELGQALGLPQRKIRVIVPSVGAGFGNKITLSAEGIAALLAKKAGRPVKVAFSREEVFTSTTIRHPFIVSVKDGVKKDGRITAREVKIILDGGAYAAGSGIHVARQCVFSACTTYRIPNFKLDSIRVSTNRVPGGPFRGFGSAQVHWAVEYQMDILAEKLALDPVEFRMINLYREGELDAVGERIRAPGYRECLQKVAQAIEWDREKKRSGVWHRGKGVAIGDKHSFAPTASVAFVKVNEDGSIEVFNSAGEVGEGSHTVLAQIAAEEFKTSFDMVSVRQVDTAITPFDPGSFATRVTYNAGNAVRLACLDAKRQILSKASKMLGVGTEELEIREGAVHAPSRSLRIADLFSSGLDRLGPVLEEGGAFLGKATWIQKAGDLDPETGQCSTDRATGFATASATGAIVEANVETGQIRTIKLVTATDTGKAINPMMVENQIQGGSVMGLGTALYEELILEDGRIINPDLKDYRPMMAVDAPKTQPIIVEVPHPEGPFGAKGCGESPIMGVAPAIANAIYDAIGVRIIELPITAEKILKALKERAS